MARLLGPDSGDRLVYVLRSGQMYAAAGMSAIAYAGSTGDTLADIAADDNGTPGSAIPGSQLAVDSNGLLPDFWLPDGADTVWIEVGTGPRVAVHAAFDPRIDAVAGTAAAALPLAGGTLTGPLTVLPGSSGAQNAIVVGDGSVSREIEMMSSYAGGQDTSANLLKFDSTSRINFYLYQQALNGSYGEPLRFHMRKRDAKAAITWRGPTSFTAWTADPNNANNLLGGDPVGSDKNWAWLIAHYEANDHGSVHGHLSVELPAADQTLQTRLAFPIWDANGVFGSDQTNITVNLSHLTVRASNSLTGTPNYLRVSGPTSVPKYLEFSLSHEPAVSPNEVRFRVGVNDDAESSGNAGSNFTIRRYADGGAFLSTSFHITRSTGNISCGTSVDESARVAAVWSTASHHGFLAKPTVSIPSTAAFASILQTSADRVGDHRVSGDTSARLAWFLDKIEFGPGNTNRDTNLYRSATDTLKTDDSLHVGATLRHLGSSLGFYNATAVTKPTVSGAKGSNAALASLLTALANLGLITDSSSA